MPVEQEAQPERRRKSSPSRHGANWTTNATPAKGAPRPECHTPVVPWIRMASLARFSPVTRAWFEAAFAAPTPAQEQGWDAISQGDHTLILAPTGSGKTLAAFLWTLDRLVTDAGPRTNTVPGAVRVARSRP